MATGVFINGTGVLGRQLIRWIIENSDVYNSSENSSSIASLEIKGINDANMSGAQLVYLLTYDTVYGKLKGHTISYDSVAGKVIVDSDSTKAIPFTNIASIDNFEQNYIADLDAKVVFDCTGNSANTTKQYGNKYIDLGAVFVYLCSDYRTDTDLSGLIFGVNTDNIDPGVSWIPSGACTAVAIMGSLIEKYAGINTGFAHIVTSYTNLNNLQDSAATYIDRPEQANRGGAVNIIPQNVTKAGAQVGLFVPSLNGKVSSYDASAGVNAGAIINFIACVHDSSANLTKWVNYLASLDASTLDLAFGNNLPCFEYVKEHIVTSDKIGELNIAFTVSYDTQNQTDDINMINITSMFDPIMVQVANMILTCAKAVK